MDRTSGDGRRTPDQRRGPARARRRLEAPVEPRSTASAVDALSLFDLILCRNVLIYFRDATIPCAVVENRRATRLRPGGRLAVGASESLLRVGTLLSCEENDGSVFYRKAPA